MNLSGKTILITGSTDGLGKLVARHMAERGAIVLLHGRNKEKGDAVLKEFQKLALDSLLKYYNADFASLQETAELAETLINEHDHIDILINNAAIGSGKAEGNRRQISKNGIELRLAVNYIAQVLLTEKLLRLLKPGSVIINVASAGQDKIYFQDLMLEKRYDGLLAYNRSKTALIMYSFDLAERLKDKDIKVNAVHPSTLMNTKMVMADWTYTLSKVEDGADALENLLFPDRTGAYYDIKRPVKAISQAYDTTAREKLRKMTREILSGYFKEYHKDTGN